MIDGVVSVLELSAMIVGLIYGPIVITVATEWSLLSRRWWAQVLEPLAADHRMARNMLRWRSYWAWFLAAMTLAIGLGWAIAAGIIVGAVMVTAFSPAALASNLVPTGWMVFRVQMALVPTCILVTFLTAQE